MSFVELALVLVLISGRKFRGVKTSISASIATDISGNKRAVKMAKLSGLL